MKLTQAASFFDKTLCVDVYNPLVSFLGQLDLFDDSKKDNIGALRRVLSASPSQVIPARRTITFSNEIWLVGRPNTDEFQGSAIRAKYDLHLCRGTALVGSIATVLAGAGGSTLYTGGVWLGSKGADYTSVTTDRMDFHFSSSETIVEKDIIFYEGKRYIVRASTLMPTSFVMATVEELREPTLETATFTYKTYDPLTDSNTTQDVNCALLRIQWRDVFDYLTDASIEYKTGDIQAYVLGSAITSPTNGDRLTLSDGNWIIKAAQLEGATWSLHLARD